MKSLLDSNTGKPIYELKLQTENRFCDLDHKVRSVGGERVRKLTFYILADFR
ncbi:cadmium efflux system accessory protein [Aggregatibacter segnis ATCC 33393]|uniref:Cadmium efflux system accessory protein n=1 Tax=Aggregatibacter segnis ATCC 33393 TaxID=888057 RepID=E6KYR6_9PAST|nr:cadmium efflux system accessory protein [Aggregatibacter segnis ATCC 33393]